MRLLLRLALHLHRDGGVKPTRWAYAVHSETLHLLGSLTWCGWLGSREAWDLSMLETGTALLGWPPGLSEAPNPAAYHRDQDGTIGGLWVEEEFWAQWLTWRWIMSMDLSLTFHQDHNPWAFIYDHLSLFFLWTCMVEGDQSGKDKCLNMTFSFLFFLFSSLILHDPLIHFLLLLPLLPRIHPRRRWRNTPIKKGRLG